MTGLTIAGTGSYIPECTVSNEMMKMLVDTSDEWIKTRTGIEKRNFAGSETNLFMTAAAVRNAIENAGIDKSEICAVICATMTGDYILPSLASMLQHELGLDEEILAFDLNAACSGFVYALSTARSILASSETKKYAVVSGSELLSKLLDYTDRSTCVLFGDGAGAAVVRLAEDEPFRFHSGTIGDSRTIVCAKSYPSANPFLPPEEKNTDCFVHMDGQEVFRFAVESIAKSVTSLFRDGPPDADMYILHQANARIISAAAKKLREPAEKFYMNIEKHGNTSAASIPIALDELNRQNKLKRGMKIVLSGFGAGLTYGSAYFTW